MSLNDMRWETNFKMDIPEFYGGIRGDSLQDWLVDVEEILELKSIPDDRLVSLVAKKIRGQAASWWQQVKTTRKQAGKNPIKSWDKLKQKLCSTFLSRNYRTMYSHLQNVKQRARFVNDYEEDFHVQDTDFINNPVHDIDNEELSTTQSHAYGAPRFDVEDEAYCDAYDDQIQDEYTSCVIPKIDDSVEDVKTIDFISSVCDPVYDVCGENIVEDIMKNGAREDFMTSQGVDYKEFSSREQAYQVFNNFDEKDEDTHIDKRKHGNSISPANRHRQIKSEPPDRGQSRVSYPIKDLNNEIYVDPSFYISIEEDTSFVVYEGHDKRVIEGKVITIEKPLVLLRSCELTRECLHVSYKTTKKDDEIYLCSLKLEFMNWSSGNENPMKISSYHQRDVVYANDVSAINHIDFFFTNGALSTIKSHMVNLCVENNIFIMLLARKCMLGKFFCGYNNLGEEDQLSSILRCCVECYTSFDKVVEAMAASQEIFWHFCLQSHARDNSYRSEELMVRRRLWNQFCDYPFLERINSQTRQLHLGKHYSHCLSYGSMDELPQPIFLVGPLCLRCSMLLCSLYTFHRYFLRGSEFVADTPQQLLIGWFHLPMRLILFNRHTVKGFLEYEVLIFDATQVVSHSRHHQLFDIFHSKNLFVNSRKNIIEIKWDALMSSVVSYTGLSLEFLNVQHSTCFLTFFGRLVSHSGRSAPGRKGDVRITPLGISYKVTTCFRWEDYVLDYTEIDIAELFEDYTKSRKDQVLVLVGSFGILLIIDGVSKILISVPRQNFIDVISTQARVVVVFLSPDCSRILFVMAIAFLVELHGGVFKRVIGAVRIPLLAPRDIFTTFICWNNVANLLTWGKLHLFLDCFSTLDHSMMCNAITDAVNSVLLLFHEIYRLMGLVSSIVPERASPFLISFWYLSWKLLNTNWDMKSACHAQPKITHNAFTNILPYLVQLHLTSSSKYKATHVRRCDLVFEPGDFVWILFSKDCLEPHVYQQASTFSPTIEINNFISPLETFGISNRGTWILFLRGKGSKEEEDFLVTRVQGSLEATIVLTKVLYGRSFSKLHLRRKKERHDILKRKYYELVDKGYLQRSKIRVESF